MAFQFYLDGQLTDQPVNDTDLQSTLRRDQSLLALLLTQDAQITWAATNNLAAGLISGYAYLKALSDGGLCQEAELQIYSHVSGSLTNRIYTGVIKVPQIEIDMQRLTLSAKVQDNNYYSYIANNKNIEYNVQAIKTKNREDITPPQAYEVDMFSSATGVYGSTVGNLYQGYRVYDVFQFLTAAISDNKVSFESQHLQEEPVIFIFDGYALANANEPPAVITSFEKLLSEIYKVRNIRFWIDSTNQDAPVLRLEKADSLFTGHRTIEFNDIKEMLTRHRTDNIYATIKVGATDNPGGADAVYTFIAGTSYLGWMEEQYAPLGQCNIDNELNLMNDYGITSNDVNDQVMGAVNSDLDKMFLVECEQVDEILFAATAIAYPSWVDTPDYYYNQGFNNPSKLLAHGSSYQTGLTNTLQIGSNGFQASRGQDLLIGTQNSALPEFCFGYPTYEIEPVVFGDETTGGNYDGSGNYSNTLGHYVCPADGLYSLGVNLDLDIVNLRNCPTGADVTVGSTYYPETPVTWGFRLRVTIAAYTDATLTTLISESYTQNDYLLNGSATLATSLTAYLPTGSVVVVRTSATVGWFNYTLGLPDPYIGYMNYLYSIGSYPYQISVGGCGIQGGAHPNCYALESSIYFCSGAPDGGGTFTAPDPALYKNREYEFDYHIAEGDWLAIAENPTGVFPFEKDGVTRYGWIQEIRHSHWTGMSKIKLITSDVTDNP